MVQNNQDAEIEYQIIDFYLDSHNPISIKEEPGEYGYGVQMERSINVEEDLIYINVLVESKSGPESNPFFQAKTTSVFNIKNLSEIQDDLSQDFIANLMAISYSTTRGYLLSFNNDNFLGKSPLPLLSIQQIAEGISDSEISEEE